MSARSAYDHRSSGTGSQASRPSRRLAALAAVIVLLVAAVAGVLALYRQTAKPAAAVVSAGAAELRVSQDFGAKAMLAKRLPVAKSSSAMALLKANAKVETAYGGNFVNAIDGVASGFTGGGGNRADWFFFVNGIQADRGAGSIKISAADRVWWDYHRWDFAPNVPAVVGQFPQPFVTASSPLPTVVEYAEGFSATAESVAGMLRGAGAKEVSVASLKADDFRARRVLVGTWSQLSGDAAVKVAAQNPESSGLFARFDDGRLVTYDQLGAVKTHDSGAGAVMATARAEAPQAAIWLITGAEKSDVEAAATLLADGAPKLQGRAGVAVLRDGSAIGLPTKAGR